jgi:hypothetical protein
VSGSLFLPTLTVLAAAVGVLALAYLSAVASVNSRAGKELALSAELQIESERPAADDTIPPVLRGLEARSIASIAADESAREQLINGLRSWKPPRSVSN